MDGLLTYLAITTFVLGLVGTPTSLIGNTVGKHLGDKPQGADDTPSKRYVYATYGGFSSKYTLIASVVLLVGGAAAMLGLRASDRWELNLDVSPTVVLVVGALAGGVVFILGRR